MELKKKNVRTILLIITFAVVLYTAAQNLSSIYDAIKTVWNVFGVVITGLAMAFVLNVPLKLFENRLFYGMSEDRRPLVRKLRRAVSLLCSLVVTLMPRSAASARLEGSLSPFFNTPRNMSPRIHL